MDDEVVTEEKPRHRRKIWKRGLNDKSALLSQLTKKNIKAKILAQEKKRSQRLKERIRKRNTDFRTSAENFIRKENITAVSEEDEMTELLKRLRLKYKDKPLRKETLKEFIKKKKEMLMVQLSIEAKNAEVQRLNKLSALKEKKLKDSESKIECEVVEFDAYLKQNNREAEEAMKMIEEETKKRRRICDELESALESVEIMKNDLNSLEEVLEESKTYATFLKKFNLDISLNLFEEAEDSGKGDLLDIFNETEEDTLFLLQNLLEAQTNHEFTKETAQTIRKKSKDELNDVEEKVRILKLELEKENLKNQNLSQKIFTSSKKSSVASNVDSRSGSTTKFGSSNPYKILLDKLNGKVLKFVDGENVETVGGNLKLLASLEEKVETALTVLENAKDEDIIPLEKEREKARREFVRKRKADAKQKIQEAKMKKMKERSEKALQQIEMKRTKPVMFRSYLEERKIDKDAKLGMGEKQAENYSFDDQEISSLL
eukprot:snap_masked-scaffold_15-processed-gene-2.58-mRNA-1 protein AED:0.98 eAED:1.00 QI:0/0/0/0.33/1/1/3/0/487